MPSRCYRPVPPHSEYSRPCPHCGARIGERCFSGNRIYWNAHKERRQGPPIIEAHPEWVAWWQSMKLFERYPRPADLRVPTQAELLRGAA
jgi:hypothetical protein